MKLKCQKGHFFRFRSTWSFLQFCTNWKTTWKALSYPWSHVYALHVHIHLFHLNIIGTKLTTNTSLISNSVRYILKLAFYHFVYTYPYGGLTTSSVRWPFVNGSCVFISRRVVLTIIVQHLMSALWTGGLFIRRSWKSSNRPSTNLRTYRQYVNTSFRLVVVRRSYEMVRTVNVRYSQQSYGQLWPKLTW